MFASEEPVHRSLAPAIFEARFQPIEASAIHCESETRISESGLGLDVQHASSKKSILRRQGACEQGNAAGKAGFERLPENRKPFRQFHAVDPELHIGMLTADMDLAKTVLSNCGHLQDHLVQRRVFALRNRRQRLRAEIISAGAEAWFNLQAGNIELLGDDLHRIEGD